MSLPHALLTALLEESCAGSELARRFDRSIGFFWHATHQQIYRELGRLEQSGWIESLPPESGRGRKKVYRVRPAGRKELKRWTSEQQDPRPLREELMLRIRAEAAIGPTSLKTDIDRRLKLHRQKLAIYMQLDARDFPPDVAPSYEAELQQLVLTAGIMYETLWIEWSEKALRLLTKKD
jgi:DNA-binding PadR family transcriptional regulator